MSVTRFLLSLPLLAAFGCATTESAAPAAAKPAAPSRPTVPAEIEAPASATLVVQLSAKGTQNYKCQTTAAGGAEWKLVAPEAELSTIPGGAAAGTHGAGPSWTLTDGSGAKGDAPNAKRAPSPESGSVAWLLIPATSNGQPGGLQGVTLVQRIDTHGGAAPATGCDAGSVGAETKVPYTATYVFYR
jgi:glucose/arabinose dehydrogenase